MHGSLISVLRWSELNPSPQATARPTFTGISEREPGTQRCHCPPSVRPSDRGKCALCIVDLPCHLPGGAMFPWVSWAVQCHPGQRSGFRQGTETSPLVTYSPSPPPALPGSWLEISGRGRGVAGHAHHPYLACSVIIPVPLASNLGVPPSNHVSLSLHPRPPTSSKLLTDPKGAAVPQTCCPTSPLLLWGQPMPMVALTKIAALATELSPRPPVCPHASNISSTLQPRQHLSP